MTAQLKNELLVSMLSGRSNEKTARIFQERFGVNAYCARRIVRTESAYVANAAQAKAYDEAGIDRYRFVATLDSRTCECCGALDGKVFELAKAKPGTNYPPMHPFCRSTTIADFGGDELEGLERRAKDKDGNTVKVPADMTYEQWKQGLSGNGGTVQLTFDDLEKSNANGALTKLRNGGIINDRKEQFLQELHSGKINTAVNERAQKKHTNSSAWRNQVKQAIKALKEGKRLTPKSRLFSHIEPQAIVNEYAGKGRFALTKSNGYNEFVTLPYDVGVTFDKKAGKYVKTNVVQIKYAEDGVHVFPTKEVK